MSQTENWRPTVRLGIVIPVGPGTVVTDTLDSIYAFGGGDWIAVLVNDTGRGIGSFGPNVIVEDAPHDCPGGLGGLWVKICVGYRRLLREGRPGVVLRMDTDALLTGSGIEADAERYFELNPHVGLLGAYRLGYDGGVRDFSPAASRLRKEIGIVGGRHPRLRKFLLDAVAGAGPDYVFGEHALGGAYIHRGSAVSAMDSRGMFESHLPRHSKMGEDHIMSLITKQAGYSIADFAGPADPMAIKWIGLPDSPETLVAKGKKVVHSVRSWGTMSEEGIRREFERLRH